MMLTKPLTRQEVLAHSALLPSFPRIVSDILASVDDPELSIKILSHCVSMDPIITARVLSVANMASVRGRRDHEVADVFTAISLIGMRRVREIALISSVGNFVDAMGSDRLPVDFWLHCVAVGVCCEELVIHVTEPMSSDTALTAGLLHDIGQLWLYGYNPVAFRECLRMAHESHTSIESAEHAQFGVDHCVIGAWLAEHWGLPEGIAAAIRHHHAPQATHKDALVAVVHVAEVLSNALDLAGRAENRVTTISASACDRLGLVWDDSMHTLFGRIEARSRHANLFFASAHAS
jgi:putative nucleotidyltransferase with HDIG domain